MYYTVYATRFATEFAYGNEENNYFIWTLGIIQSSTGVGDDELTLNGIVLLLILMMFAVAAAFCSPLSLSRERPRGKCISKRQAHGAQATPVKLRAWRQTRLCRMVTPQPDDTALDMVSFALSGPGIFAFGAFATISAIILFTNFDLFPRRGNTSPRSTTPFFIQVRLEQPATVEFPDGVARRVPKGESIFRFPSREACDAVARTFQKQSCKYAIYRLDGISVKTLTTWPRDINVPNSAWPANSSFIQGDDNSAPESACAWDEYERVGSVGELDHDWSSFLRSMGSGPIVEHSRAPCRLCGGSGFTRCFRCGGATPVEGSSFICDCQQGRRPCEWCNLPLQS